MTELTIPSVETHLYKSGACRLCMQLGGAGANQEID